MRREDGGACDRTDCENAPPYVTLRTADDLRCSATHREYRAAAHPGDASLYL